MAETVAHGRHDSSRAFITSRRPETGYSAHETLSAMASCRLLPRPISLNDRLDSVIVETFRRVSGCPRISRLAALAGW
jgi:hypothetical protein